MLNVTKSTHRIVADATVEPFDWRLALRPPTLS
jgi:hypothetical protein